MHTQRSTTASVHKVYYTSITHLHCQNVSVASSSYVSHKTLKTDIPVQSYFCFTQNSRCISLYDNPHLLYPSSFEFDSKISIENSSTAFIDEYSSPGVSLDIPPRFLTFSKYNCHILNTSAVPRWLFMYFKLVPATLNAIGSPAHKSDIACMARIASLEHEQFSSSERGLTPCWIIISASHPWEMRALNTIDWPKCVKYLSLLQYVILLVAPSMPVPLPARTDRCSKISFSNLLRAHTSSDMKIHLSSSNHDTSNDSTSSSSVCSWIFLAVLCPIVALPARQNCCINCQTLASFPRSKVHASRKTSYYLVVECNRSQSACLTDTPCPSAKASNWALPSLPSTAALRYVSLCPVLHDRVATPKRYTRKLSFSVPTREALIRPCWLQRNKSGRRGWGALGRIWLVFVTCESRVYCKVGGG